MVKEVTAVIAALAPWMAIVVLIFAAAVIIARSQKHRKTLLFLLVLCFVSGSLLFVGPSILRQHGLSYRCWPHLALVGIFFAAVASTILLTVVCFCRQEEMRLWESWAVTLSGLILLVTCLFACLVFAGFTVRTEEVGVWNGQKAVMIEQGGGSGRYHYYEYSGLIVMGEYLDTSENRWEGEN